MPSSCVVRGQSGVIQWGYHRAAQLGAWTFTADADGGELSAKVELADAFKLSQPDLAFKVIRQTGPALIWPVLSLQYADDTVTARLGLQE